MTKMTGGACMISSRMTVAAHILSMVHIFEGQVTSEFIASSVNTNPAVIRKLMSMLGKAKLIESRPGVTGIRLLKPVSQITLLDLLRAVEPPEKQDLFSIHQNSNPDCPIGSNIQDVLHGSLSHAQSELERSLAQTTLEHVVQEIKIRSKMV
jgi:DNA-binding IscR family transcriptional regulator